MLEDMRRNRDAWREQAQTRLLPAPAADVMVAVAADGRMRRCPCSRRPPSRQMPCRQEGRTNLDTQAWCTGRLVIGVFDDEVAGGPVSLLEVRGEPVESKKK